LRTLARHSKLINKVNSRSMHKIQPREPRSFLTLWKCYQKMVNQQKVTALGVKITKWLLWLSNMLDLIGEPLKSWMLTPRNSMRKMFLNGQSIPVSHGPMITRAFSTRDTTHQSQITEIKTIEGKKLTNLRTWRFTITILALSKSKIPLSMRTSSNQNGFLELIWLKMVNIWWLPQWKELIRRICCTIWTSLRKSTHLSRTLLLWFKNI